MTRIDAGRRGRRRLALAENHRRYTRGANRSLAPSGNARRRADNDEAVYERESRSRQQGKACGISKHGPGRGRRATITARRDGRGPRQGRLAGKAESRGRENRTAQHREAIDEFNFFSQMAVLRKVHALQRTTGESPQTLAALVRAYANLGQLTKFHWNRPHKAFAARPLCCAATGRDGLRQCLGPAPSRLRRSILQVCTPRRCRGPEGRGRKRGRRQSTISRR